MRLIRNIRRCKTRINEETKLYFVNSMRPGCHGILQLHTEGSDVLRGWLTGTYVYFLCLNTKVAPTKYRMTYMLFLYIRSSDSLRSTIEDIISSVQIHSNQINITMR